MKTKMFSGGRNANNLVQINLHTSSNRSKIMKYNHLYKSVATVLVALIISASSVFAQGNAALSGTVSNSGTIKVKGSLSGSVTTIGGTVEFGAAGAQSIPSGYTFTNLTGSGSGAKTLAGDVTVLGTMKADAATVDIGANKLALGGGITVQNSGSFVATAGTVDYNSNGAQSLYATTYKNLTTSGASSAVTKSASGNIAVIGTLTNGVNTTLDFGTNSLTATGATFANSNVLKSSGTVTVDATASIGGTFEYASATAGQTVASASYTSLTLSGAAKTLAGTYNVAGVYTPGAFTHTYTGSTFNYDGTSGSQTIVAQSYNILGLSGASTKSITAGIASVAGAFTHAGGDLTLNGGSLTLGTTGSFAGLTITSGTLTGGTATASFAGAVSNAGTITAGSGLLDFTNTLGNTGTINVGAGHEMDLASTFTNSGTLTFNATSTIKYLGSSAQSIADATYGNLSLSNSAKTVGTSTVSTALTASSDVTVSTGLTISSSASFAGNLVNNGAITATGSSVTLNGAGQTISGNDITFNNLTLAGTATKTSSANLTIAGTFTPTYGLDITGKTLTVNGTVGTFGSLQEVKGTMIVAAPAAAAYTLNNASTVVTFSTANATRTFGLTVNPTTAPNAGYAVATDVNRKIAVSYANWSSGTADLKLAYTQTEAPSGVGNEAKLRDFKNDQSVAGNKIVTGSALVRTASGSGVFGAVELPGITSSLLATNDAVVLSARSAAFITIAATGDWNTGSTWDEGSIPGATDEAIINTTGVTLNAAGSVNSLTINAGKDLTLGNATSALTVTAGVTNNGSLTLSNASSTLNVTGTITNATGATLSNAGVITVQ
jgi:hypothetical protein